MASANNNDYKYTIGVTANMLFAQRTIHLCIPVSCIDGTIISTMKHNEGDRIGNRIIYEEEETKRRDQIASLLDEQPKSRVCLNDKRLLAKSHIHRIRERNSLRTVLPIAHPPFSVLTSPSFPLRPSLRATSTNPRGTHRDSGFADLWRAASEWNTAERRAVFETCSWIRQIRYFVFRFPPRAAPGAIPNGKSESR